MTSCMCLGAYWSPNSKWQPKGRRHLQTDWSAYAETYDLLSEHNPAYQALLKEFESALDNIATPKLIYDVGGGTGNYSVVAAKRYPGSSICLIEPNHGMNMRAREKLSTFDNVAYSETPLQEFEASAKADLVICVHALYAMPDPLSRLADLRKLLKPDGVLFLVDLGRKLDVADWRTYLFSHLTKTLGLTRALRVLWQGREIARQNKAIFKAQEENIYWTHSASEIAEAVENAGFEILAQKAVYRGYSDLLLCRAVSE